MPPTPCNWKFYYVGFLTCRLISPADGSSIRAKVLLGLLLIDITVHHIALVKQALIACLTM
jgi:hypothetical protein